MTLLIGALTIGLILSLLALGVFISFRIFDFPDITADGSITLGARGRGGAARAWQCIRCVATLAALAPAAVAGHADRAPPHALQDQPAAVRHPRDDGALLGQPARHGEEQRAAARRSGRWRRWRSTAATRVLGRGDRRRTSSAGRSASRDVATLVAGAGRGRARRRRCSTLFFRTDLGTAMRAAGDNAQMIRALGVNVGNMIMLGLALSNGLVALSGRAAGAVSGLRRRADGHRHGGLGPRQRDHRRGAGRRAAARASSSPAPSWARCCSACWSPSRCAAGLDPERPEADHRGRSCSRRWSCRGFMKRSRRIGAAPQRGAA